MRFVVEKKRDPIEQMPTVTREKFMQALMFKAIAEIKEVMSSGIFKHPTGALMNSISGYIIHDEIIIYSDKRYARAQEFGVKAYQMWHLLGKTVPLKVWMPYRSDPDTVFRKVSLKSLMNGGWTHPGFAGKYFMRQGIDRAMKVLPELRTKIYSGEENVML